MIVEKIARNKLNSYWVKIEYVKKYINKYNKRPTARSKNKEES